MPGLEKNRIYRACIQGYSSEGLGIARIDGQVVFVHGAIRGEICDVLVMKVLKNAAFGKIAALVEPSPARRTPDCPYYGRCGGCESCGRSVEGGFDSLGVLRTGDREHPPVCVRHGMARVVVLPGDIHRGGCVDHVEKIVCLFRGIIARGDDTCRA